MAYSTTKAVLHKLLPAVFPPQLQGYRGYGALGAGTGVSLSSNMMLGMAVGGVGAVLWCKNKHKIKGKTA